MARKRLTPLPLSHAILTLPCSNKVFSLDELTQLARFSKELGVGCRIRYQEDTRPQDPSCGTSPGRHQMRGLGY